MNEGAASDLRFHALAAADAGAAAGLFQLAACDGGASGWSATAIAGALGRGGFGVAAWRPNGGSGPAAPGLVGAALALAAGDDAEIANIVVRPDQRHTGIGAGLVLRLAAAAKSAGFERLLLEVAADNPAARALYGGLGFTTVATRKAYYKRAAGFVNAEVMASSLSDRIKASR